MKQHASINRRIASFFIIASSALFLSGLVFAIPLTFTSAWFVDEGPSIVTGDAPTCSAHFTLQDELAVGGLHLVTNQDSPFFGKTSQAEKQVQFERPFTVEEETRVALFAELVGTLRIEGGQGRIVVRAAALVLDAGTYLPVAGLEITSNTAPDRFDHALQEPGTVEIEDSGVQIATLPAGSYIVLGSIEATTRMDKGWWNHEAEADVTVSLEEEPVETEEPKETPRKKVRKIRRIRKVKRPRKKE